MGRPSNAEKQCDISFLVLVYIEQVDRISASGDVRFEIIVQFNVL